tara:strand:+ start:346 stop:681 length:336 start_codon:yes stop_codon:yes gene_type:complete
MALTAKNIIPRKRVETTQTTQYTSQNATTVIDKLTVTNTGINNTTISINLPRSGEMPSDSNLVLDFRTIAPRETYTCPEIVGQILASGGYISTIAGLPDALTISASGTLIP